MKIVSRVELFGKISKIQQLALEVAESLNQPDVLIADIPSPEKKIRKKRVRKENPTPTENARQSGLLVDKSKRGRRARHTFGEPKLREGETPL